MSYEKLSVALMLALALVSCRNTENRYYTWVDKAALREAPSLDARTVAWLDQGEDVEFTGERSKHTTNVELRHQRFDRHWITVKTASGHTGWMHEATLKPYGELLKRVANERDWNPEYESILLPLIKGNAREFAKAAASMRVPGAPEPGMPARNFPRLMHQYAGYTDTRRSGKCSGARCATTTSRRENTFSLFRRSRPGTPRSHRDQSSPRSPTAIISCPSSPRTDGGSPARERPFAGA